MACRIESDYDHSDAQSEAMLQSELAEVRELEGQLEAGNLSAAAKIAKYKNYRAHRSRS